MYTQQYDKEKAKLNVPHNYSGNALLEEYEKKEDEKRAGEFSSDIDCEKDKVDEADEKEVMAKPKDKAFLSPRTPWRTMWVWGTLNKQVLRFDYV